ncbi:hypothetical protein EUGRSUZ_F02947 [Eucalyptus grandis]|uniref:Uncharacterized protein n=2 Tax=Eucalyptus grandis TaxID=71139 RepID=A0ACC3KJS7_EUCGR|nr:hypothetical protein EUGRSUZ_F02947 [Eucalyptus grandis]
MKICTSVSYQDADNAAMRPHQHLLADFMPHIFHLSLTSIRALFHKCRNDHGDKTTATTRQLHFVIKRDYFYVLFLTSKTAR